MPFVDYSFIQNSYDSYYEKFTNGESRCIDNDIPFDIPYSWQFIRLKNIYELLSGRDLSPSEYNDSEEGVPYITGASNFRDGEIVINRWTSRPQVKTETGDLLITCKGTVGELSINSFGEAHIARQIMAIRNIFSQNIDFLRVCISYYVELLKHQSKGLIPGISREDVLNLLLPVPPDREQNRICTALHNVEIILSDIQCSIT